MADFFGSKGALGCRVSMLLVALLLGTTVFSAGAGVGAPGEGSVVSEMLTHAKKGAGENLGGVPVELLWKDIYPVVVQQGVGGFFRMLLREIQNRTTMKAPIGVADVIMQELERALFGNSGANQASWKKIKAKYEALLREWWVTTPEEPFSALQSGVWKTLLQLYAEELKEAFRGSPRGKLLTDLLFDENLKLISRWTDAEHIRIMRLSRSAARRSALRKLFRAEERQQVQN
ncbi:dense granule protein DG32 [Besnoitia besnoiti]|uniref:Dense granule protein DG32 n=1 Tax=Besnoitia besnoiti TaxID=94643 RepID=A0A2A9MIK7_BESBE|nr:dense granule protein DG32 [Besnoitia besnoiti]PFH35473.1 dense granule protein DG32 [Besnoitia besnoiti]